LQDHHQALIKRLRELREDAALTQETVAELAGISYKHYQSLEAGRKPDVRLTTLCMIADAYGLEPWELLYSQKPVLSPKFQRGTRHLKRKRAKSGS
jgi:transcriptional regulator with XRE-family HTH domain